jgi:hypothetical protein
MLWRNGLHSEITRARELVALTSSRKTRAIALGITGCSTAIRAGKKTQFQLRFSLFMEKLEIN